MEFKTKLVFLRQNFFIGLPPDRQYVKENIISNFWPTFYFFHPNHKHGLFGLNIFITNEFWQTLLKDEKKLSKTEFFTYE